MFVLHVFVLLPNCNMLKYIYMYISMISVWNEFDMERVCSLAGLQWDKFWTERVWMGRVHNGTTLHISGWVYLERVYNGTS